MRKSKVIQSITTNLLLSITRVRFFFYGHMRRNWLLRIEKKSIHHHRHNWISALSTNLSIYHLKYINKHICMLCIISLALKWASYNDDIDDDDDGKKKHQLTQFFSLFMYIICFTQSIDPFDESSNHYSYSIYLWWAVMEGERARMKSLRKYRIMNGSFNLSIDI